MGLSVNERLRAAVVSALQLDGVEQLSADGKIQLSLVVGNLDSTTPIPTPRANHSAAQELSPASNAIQARSGLLIAGTYDFAGFFDINDATSRQIDFQLRNAAATADIWFHRVLIDVSKSTFHFSGCSAVEDDEELQIRNASALTAGSTIYSSLIWARRATS